MQLLDGCPKSMPSSESHDTNTAPLMMRDAYMLGVGNNNTTQYGVLGKTLTVGSVSTYVYGTSAHSVALVVRMATNRSKTAGYTSTLCVAWG